MSRRCGCGLSNSETTVTIIDKVKQHYTLPLTPYPFQTDTIEDLGERERGGYYLEPGCGKTLCSTVSALYKKVTRHSQTIVVMPPILIDGWHRFLTTIQPELSITAYKGSPKTRLQLSLDSAFILMSMEIFKKDYDHISAHMRGRPTTLIIDEAHSIKNISSGNHKTVNNFVLNNDCHLMLLTGTPLTSPADAYAYIKLIAPGTYRNLGQFERIHVGERDFFNKVKSWQRLDVLAENMQINSRRVNKEEVLEHLPKVQYTPIFYDLAPAHLKMYNTLAEHQLLLLKDGGKIDATSASALWNNLQQIILNWSYFAQDDSKRPAGFDLLDAVLDELGDRKLLVAANYRMSNRRLIEYTKPYGGVGIFGELSDKAKNENKRRFIEDPTCRVLIIQPRSAGYGVDGLQQVCSDLLFMESPLTPPMFEQTLARLYRDGQPYSVNCRIAVASRTLQVPLHKSLLDKDDLIAGVQGKFDNLRNMIYGGETATV